MVHIMPSFSSTSSSLAKLLARSLAASVSISTWREVRAHHLAQAGEVGVVALAAEQRTAQLVLEPLDGAGQRRLRDIAGFGRAREVERLADGQKITDLMHFHGSSPPKPPSAQYARDHHSLRLSIPVSERYFRSVAGPRSNLRRHGPHRHAARALSRRHMAGCPGARPSRLRGRARPSAHAAGRRGRAGTVGDLLPDFALQDGDGPGLDLGRAARSRTAGAGVVPRRLVPLLQI